MEKDEEALPPSEYIAPREKSFCPPLESVDELDRLAVGVRHHDVRAGLDVGEHGLRRRRLRRDPSPCHRRTLPSAVAFDELVDHTVADDALGLRTNMPMWPPGRPSSGVVGGTEPPVQGREVGGGMMWLACATKRGLASAQAPATTP
jgi:hypothetical protein